MNKTTIEWTDYTWNPVTGCNKISQGCKLCYAETMATRFWGMRKFTDVRTHPERLNEPIEMGKKLHGKKGFVCDVSDLFHEKVSDFFILSVFETIQQCPNTIFQILTKRIDRALEWFRITESVKFPLPNVWIGTSCEDQANADERIPLLLQIPAVVRFLSCEPLIGPIDICSAIRLGQHPNEIHTTFCGDKIHWVIAGGESGHGARPMHPDWVRSLRDQCHVTDIPFFFKQWGEYMPVEDDAQPPFLQFANGDVIDGHAVNILDPDIDTPGTYNGHRFMSAMESITFCIENEAGHCNFWKCGKSKSGHVLDGKVYQQFPLRE